jgi:hypothetical protein
MYCPQKKRSIALHAFVKAVPIELMMPGIYEANVVMWL